MAEVKTQANQLSARGQDDASSSVGAPAAGLAPDGFLVRQQARTVPWSGNLLGRGITRGHAMVSPMVYTATSFGKRRKSCGRERRWSFGPVVIVELDERDNDAIR